MSHAAPAAPTTPVDAAIRADYEQLRRYALGEPGGVPRGLALLVRRGLKAWMEACTLAVRPTTKPSIIAGAELRVPAGLVNEVVCILAGMGLSARRGVKI